MTATALHLYNNIHNYVDKQDQTYVISHADHTVVSRYSHQTFSQFEVQ